MNLIGLLISNRKNTLIAVVIGVVILYTMYNNYTAERTEVALEDAKMETAIVEKEKVIVVSNAINNVNFDIVQKELDGTRYEGVDLPEDYVDPDFGVVFEFGADDV